jgi:DNA-binding transcriptional LysR family regulator
MHFSALKYFLETARLGSIRRAAEVLYVAPSAVSRQISLLEQRFGAPLFDRHSDGVRLTPAGRIFAAQARSTTRDFERLQSELDDLQQLRRGVVRVASADATIVNVLYRAIREFRKTYPSIEYVVQVLGSVKALTSLACEDCDLAILFEPSAHADVVEDSAFVDPIVAVASPHHPLAKYRKISIQQLAQHPIALLDDSYFTHRVVMQTLAQYALQPKIALTLSQAGFASTYAREGLGLTVVPRLLAAEDIDAGLVREIAIEHPQLQSTRFVLCRHRTRPPSLPAQAFLVALRAQFQKLRTAKNARKGNRRS